MKFTRSFIILVIGVLLTTACASTRVRVNTPYEGGIPVDSLNLVSVMLGPIWQPVLPLIDAAAFNEKTNKIADQILTEEQKRIEDYKAILVASLSEKLRSNIVTSNNFTCPEAEPYRVKEGVQVDNKNFPVVFFGDQDMNMLDLRKGKNIDMMFKSNKTLQANIAKYAADLKINNVLLSYNRLAVINVGMFGITGNIRLESYLFLYNAQGQLVMDTYGVVKPTSINGKELNDYKFQLDNFRVLAELTSQELTEYIK
ncbi:MAG: hypothetical protein AAF223_19040 [Bacteroidota bacterium]